MSLSCSSCFLIISIYTSKGRLISASLSNYALQSITNNRNTKHPTSLKMKTTFAALSLLAVSALAAPPAPPARQTIFPKIAVSVINDQTGASAVATVVADGTVFHLLTLFGGSAIDIHGVITASSAQLVAFVDNVFCSFNKD